MSEHAELVVNGDQMMKVKGFGAGSFKHPQTGEDCVCLAIGAAQGDEVTQFVFVLTAQQFGELLAVLNDVPDARAVEAAPALRDQIRESMEGQ